MFLSLFTRATESLNQNNIENMENIHSFTAAVRGYHYYRHFWKPKQGEELMCAHEKNNAFDRFAIKVVAQNGDTVGHLQREISRITKFYLDRGASMHVELTSRHYRRSPLVQGGMEIVCSVIMKMPATLRNTKITEKYLEMVKEKYAEPNEEEILGCYVNGIPNPIATMASNQKQTKEKYQPQIKKSTQHDIRDMFAKKKAKNADVIEID